MGEPYETGLGFRSSLLRLIESPARSYEAPLPEPPSTFLAQEFYARVGVHPNLAIMAALPVWTRFADETNTGLGDTRVGLLAAHCTGHHGGHMFAAHIDVTLPTGRQSLGFGHGGLGGRVLTGYRYSSSTWALAFQTGVGHTWQSGSGVIAEYDVTALFRLGSRWTFSAGLAGATHLTSGSFGAPSQPPTWQEAGYSSFRSHASAHIAMGSRLNVHAELQIPVTSWADTPLAVALGAEVRFGASGNTAHSHSRD